MGLSGDHYELQRMNYYENYKVGDGAEVIDNETLMKLQLLLLRISRSQRHA